MKNIKCLDYSFRILVVVVISLCNLSIYAQCYKGDQKENQPILEGVDQNTVAEGNTSVYVPMDPNEIIGTKGYDALGDTLQWVAATTSLPYTIYFENDLELARRWK